MKQTIVSWLIGSVIFVLVLIAGLAIIKEFNIYYPVRMTQTNSTSEFVVSGEGKVDVVPDTAYVDVGITVSGVSTVQAVQDQINMVNNKILEGVKSLGVSSEDIKTTNYSVNPQYDYSKEGSSNQITGYTGNAMIQIKVKEKDKAPRVVQVASDAGANQINGVRFSVENIDEFKSEATKKAIDNAKKQAEILAKELGIRLGKVTNAVESGGNTPIPFMEKAVSLDSRGAGGAPTFESGTQTVSTTMTLYFEKK